MSTFTLNAWLDIKAPRIQIMSTITNNCILQFSTRETLELINQRIIDIEDLYSADSTTQRRIIRELFLYASCRDMGCSGKQTNACQDCKQAHGLEGNNFQSMASTVSELMGLQNKYTYL